MQQKRFDAHAELTRGRKFVMLLIMHFSRSRVFLATAAVALTAVGLMTVRFALIKSDIAALWSTVEPWPGNSTSSGRPGWLPEVINTWICRLVERLTGNSEAALRSCNDLHIFLGGSVDGIDIEVATALHGDLNAALQRFPDLKGLVLTVSEGCMTEADATKISMTLRTMPRLQKVILEAFEFTDLALAPLAGHPSIAVLATRGPVTRRSIPTFSSLPSLRYLSVSPDSRVVALDEVAVIRQALPSHVVEFARR